MKFSIVFSIFGLVSVAAELPKLFRVSDEELNRIISRRRLVTPNPNPPLGAFTQCVGPIVVTEDNYSDYQGNGRDIRIPNSERVYCSAVCPDCSGPDTFDLRVWSPQADDDVEYFDGTFSSSGDDTPDFTMIDDDAEYYFTDDDNFYSNYYNYNFITPNGAPTFITIDAMSTLAAGEEMTIRCFCTGQRAQPAEEPCFSGETTVDVLGQGPTKMSDVSVGDKVLTSSNTYEPLLGFTHKEPSKASSFFQLYADGIEAPLEVTGNHLVYTEGRAAPVPANSLKEGDKLVGRSGVHVITKIDEIVREGLYTPMTSSGDIVVNGLKASNYVMLQKGSEYAVFKNGMSTGISQHSGIHMFASPFRMMCKAGFSSVCTVEDGYLSWVEQGIKFAKYADTLNTIPQMFLLVAALAIFAPFYALEMAGYALPLLALGAFALRRTGVSAKIKTA